MLLLSAFLQRKLKERQWRTDNIRRKNQVSMNSRFVQLRISLVVLLFCAVTNVTARAQVAADPAITPASRKTSTPYTGDLSHFDYPDRAEKLQVNRVMDLLGLKPGTNVADI